ncbi:MAG: hypothetical protein JWR18_133 [Segetibacter sp.]|jgi:hypothetical protein|nr:hypothetical protein [Segetibacter sp.]
MKFFCHIRVCDANYARTTYLVKHSDHSVFDVEPVQHHLFDNGNLGSFKLYKMNGNWNVEFDAEAKRVSENIIGDIVAELDKKLEQMIA